VFKDFELQNFRSNFALEIDGKLILNSTGDKFGFILMDYWNHTCFPEQINSYLSKMYQDNLNLIPIEDILDYSLYFKNGEVYSEQELESFSIKDVMNMVEQRYVIRVNRWSPHLIEAYQQTSYEKSDMRLVLIPLKFKNHIYITSIVADWDTYYEGIDIPPCETMIVLENANLSQDKIDKMSTSEAKFLLSNLSNMLNYDMKQQNPMLTF
jgi:hypothetical protein